MAAEKPRFTEFRLPPNLVHTFGVLDFLMTPNIDIISAHISVTPQYTHIRLSRDGKNSIEEILAGATELKYIDNTFLKPAREIEPNSPLDIANRNYLEVMAYLQEAQKTAQIGS